MIQQFLESPNDPILQEDLESIVNSEAPVDALRNSTLFVTGATGLIGSLIVKTIACYNRLKGTNIRLLAFVRNEEKAKNIFGNILDRSEIKLIIGDVTDEIHIDENIDYIIHGAGPTASKYFVEHPVETILTTLDGTRNVLELAKTKKIKSMVYLSSMEVYGKTPDDKEIIAEDDLGYIDIHNVRSSYPEGKRICECLCASYAGEYNIPVKIARPALTFGAGAAYDSSRVFGQFARSVIEHKDIVLHTTGETRLNYCYTTDAIKGLIYILINGKNSEAYNLAQEKDAISVRNIAEMLVHNFPEAGMRVKIELPQSKQSCYPAATQRVLNTAKIQQLGCKVNTCIEDAFYKLISSMRTKTRI